MQQSDVVVVEPARSVTLGLGFGWSDNYLVLVLCCAVSYRIVSYRIVLCRVEL